GTCPGCWISCSSAWPGTSTSSTPPSSSSLPATPRTSTPCTPEHRSRRQETSMGSTRQTRSSRGDTCQERAEGDATSAAVTRDAGWQRAARRARLLSWLSLVYMAAEGAIAIIAAVMAGSVALLGFGLDSAIEG